jgi:hypothetical protein
MPVGAANRPLARAGRSATHELADTTRRRQRTGSIMTFPFVRPRPYPNSFILAVRLRGAPTRRQQRAFFSAMHAEARHHGLVMGHKFGLCIVFGAERLCTNHSRHQMINWLVDHQAVRGIEVSQLMAFASLFSPDSERNPLIRNLGPATPEQIAAVQMALHRAAYGTLLQWVAHLRGAL